MKGVFIGVVIFVVLCFIVIFAGVSCNPNLEDED